MDTDGPTLTPLFAALAVAIVILSYYTGRGWIRLVIRTYQTEQPPATRDIVINVVLSVLLLAAISFAGFSA